MPLTPGASLGPYVIRSLLGSGGMGEVYLAHDTKLDRDVALKLLPAELANDSERLRRFELEARSASALNHPAIVAIYDLGQAESQPYISMELVEGQTLRQILQAGSMQPRRALQVAAPIADGLAKAHEAGIVHRDLKPENLMVSHDGFAKILDFGLAKLVDDADARAALQTMTEKGTRPGSVMGTVGYMSPEQASGGTADNRSDQFSFGLVLYEMLTGRRAFNRPTAVETLSAIIREDPPPVGATQSVGPGASPMDRRPLSREEPGGSVRVHARSGAGSGERARSFFRVDELGRDSRVGGSACRAAQKAGTRRVGARRHARARGGRPDGPPDRRAARRGVTGPSASRSRRRRTSPSNSGFATSPFAVSPDGHHLVFAGRGNDGRRGLWLHSFDSLVSRPLPGTEGAFGPFWSPDGLAVGFFTENRLKRTSIAGGDVATICEARFGGGAHVESRRRDCVRAGDR